MWIRKEATALGLTMALAAAGCGGDGSEGDWKTNLAPYKAPLISAGLTSINYLTQMDPGTIVNLDDPLPRLDEDMPEPTFDWVHWGRSSASNVDRQRGVIQYVPNYTKLGSGTVSRSTTNAPSIRWNAGSPTKTNTGGSSGGIKLSGAGNGFQIAFPVQTDMIYCDIYGQAFGSAGTLTVSMSDNSTPPKSISIPVGKPVNVNINFQGSETAKANVALRSGANGSIVLNAAACGHGDFSPISLAIEPTMGGEPYYGGGQRPVKATILADNFVKMAFYQDGVKFAEDTTPPFEGPTTLVPGFRFFQVVATRADNTTYRTPVLRVPVWIAHPVSAGVATIPDNDPAGLTQTINVTEGPANLKVIDFIYRPDIQHPYVSDLKLQVIAPDGTTVTAADHLGGDGDNYFYTTFWDRATDSITQGTPPFWGNFKPMNPFSVFNGKSPNGTWKFKVIDQAPADVGVWNWKMLFILPD